MHNNTTELRQFVEEKPLTSLGGALLVGFALGSGAAMPILLGAGLSRAGLGGMVKGWLRHEAEQGLRQWLQRQQPEPPADASPGETPLARKVREELAGYRGTDVEVSESVQADKPSH